MPIEAAFLATALITSGQAAPEAVSCQESTAAQRTVALDLPVSLDDVLLGEIVAQINGSNVAVRPSDIVPIIAKEIDEATASAALAVSVDDEGFAPICDLQSAGLIITYQPDTLSLAVSLPASQRRLREISIRSPVSVSPDDAIAPADFSVGLTAITRVAHVHTGPGNAAGFEAVRSDLFGFANIGGFEGWNLIWSADLDTGRDAFLRRGNVALTKDDFDNATRLTIGDLRTHPLSNFQRSADLLGVSFRRAYQDIQPFRTLLPRGRESFTLDRRARVLVEVDGLIVFDEQLPQGSYNLGDFPFTTGSNNAVVTVDDGAGPREIAFLSAFIDSDLLSEGLSRFDLNIGVLSNGLAASSRYTDDPAIVASYDTGLSTNLTVGAHLEASLDVIQASGRAVIGTPIGLFSGEAGISQSDNGFGASAVFQYRNQFETGTLRHNVAAQASWRNNKFHTLAGPELSETSFDLRWLVQAEKVQFSANASYRDTFQGRSSSLALGATWRLLNANWSARGQVVRRSGRSDDYRATLSVSLPLGRSSRARARVATNGDIRAEFQKLGGFSVGESQLRAQVSRSPEGQLGAGGQIRHISNRAELEFDHQTRETPNGVFSRSEATAAIGIGFADGALQFGRPFDSGFVIVKRHETIKDRKASMQEGGLGVAARSDIFGPPLIPLRAGYSNYAFSVEVDELEPGYDLGVDRIEVLPGFRAGYRVDIGSEIKATVLARLQLPDGEAISLSTGRVFNAEDGSEISRFFTNRTGRFVAENLAPGDYELKIDGRSDLIAKITIEEGDTGIIQLGNILMEKVQ